MHEDINRTPFAKDFTKVSEVLKDIQEEGNDTLREWDNREEETEPRGEKPAPENGR